MKDILQSINQIIASLYNQYVLTDFMGYVLPGALLIFNFDYYFKFILQTQRFLKRLTFFNKYLVALFFISVSYLVGHIVAGYFFNSFIDQSWWHWRYLPFEKIHSNYEQMQFELDYQCAVKIVGNTGITLGNDRFQTLKHLTGYGSAALVLMSLLNLTFLYRNIKDGKKTIGLLLVIVPLIASHGLFRHFTQLNYRSFWYKENTIKEAIYLTQQQPATEKPSKDTSSKIVRHLWFRKY